MVGSLFQKEEANLEIFVKEEEKRILKRRKIIFMSLNSRTNRH